MIELDALLALADAEKAGQMAAYHKAARTCLGVPNPQIDALVADWRASRDLDGRIALAAALWASDIHEARIAAAKLLTQARIRPDDAVWALIAGWAPDFDGWAIADTAMIAGQKRLVADPARLDQVETWLDHPNTWTRRAALVGTLPWAKMNNPKPDDLATRERVLDWAARLADDRDGFIQKAIAWWLRDLSKRDAPRVRAFLADHGARMKPFARKEALRLVQER
ncbi:DNA alkylation repair protein [Paracoccus sp. S3-43]|uniref:DNA alkylation repair protein n=1 Tax=Paracoccus sp. S3-43 TaxID=3030011 RepID=UPI0023AE7F5C|nr:DNA alkylation repair protein [Paracoccus sp. S3-43]WEF25552.1 DNA alkylation repair protein [Paracoccus sp. S3-43]